MAGLKIRKNVLVIISTVGKLSCLGYFSDENEYNEI